MNGLDIAILALLAVLVLLGLLKGLVRLLIGTAALLAAFVLASQFHGAFGEWMRRWIDLPDAAMLLLAWLAIFFGTMIAGAILAYLLRKLLKAAMLSWADRLAGAAVGFAAAALVSALLILPIVAYAPSGEQMLRESTLAPYVSVVADAADRLVPEEMSAEYRRKIDDLRHYWREKWDSARDAV